MAATSSSTATPASPSPLSLRDGSCSPADDMPRCAGATGHCCGRCASLANCRTCRFSFLCCTTLFPCRVVFSLVRRVWPLRCRCSCVRGACVWREWPAFLASTASGVRVCVPFSWSGSVWWPATVQVGSPFKIGTSSDLKNCMGGGTFSPLLRLVQLLSQFGLVGARHLAVRFCQTCWTGWHFFFFFPLTPLLAFPHVNSHCQPS